VPVAFTGSWPAVAAWGAGLILAALGAGGVVGPDASAATRGVGVLLFSLGLAWLAWGTASIARGRILVPGLVLGGAVAGMLLGATLLVLSPAHTSVFAVGAAMVLILVTGTYAARARRRRERSATPRAMSVWGLILAAAVLSVVVTPALGATQDAVLIRGDGTVPVGTHDGH
jgi:hypothetical protein